MAEVDPEIICSGSDVYVSLKNLHRSDTSQQITEKAAINHDHEGSENSDICSVTCGKHPGQKLIFFCMKHDAVACVKCYITEHKKCKLLDIATARIQCNTSSDRQSIIGRVSELRNEIKNVKVAARKCGNNAENRNLEAISDIKQARKLTNQLFDKAEKDLLETFEVVKCYNEDEHQSINDDLQDTESKLASIQAHLSVNTTSLNDMFAESKKSRDIIEATVKKISDIKTVQFQCMRFRPYRYDDEESTLANLLGELESVPISLRMPGKSIRELNGKLAKQIRTRSKITAQPEHISGIVNVRKDIVACVDGINKFAYLVDVQDGKCISAVALTDNPWDITRTSQDSLAVTLTAREKIQFLGVDSNVLSDKQPLIDVKGKCRGIDCFDRKLVVAYEQPSKIEIIDFHGNVVKRIQNDWLKSPLYVAVSYDDHYIVASDKQEHCLYKMTFDGKCENMLKNETLKNPEGICVCRDGSVLVGDDDVLHVADDFISVCVLHKGKLDHVSALCYDEDRKILCLSQQTPTSIFVYQF